MSTHSYTRVWLHLIWGTLDREKLLLSREARCAVSRFLHEYAQEKEIYMKINYVNPDHVHSLIDLPTCYLPLSYLPSRLVLQELQKVAVSGKDQPVFF